MRLTATQLSMLLSMHATAAPGPRASMDQVDAELAELGLVEAEPGTTFIGLTPKGIDTIGRVLAIDVPEPGERRQLGLMDAPGGRVQLNDKDPVFMVANATLADFDTTSEVACLPRPPAKVFANEADANARAIELAVAVRGTSFVVLQSRAVYRVDAPTDVEPVKRF
jgi:hypothetical protein